MQLDTLKGVFGQDGPYVTVHLDVSRTTEDARQQLDARWTTTRHELESHEVPAEVIEDIEGRLRERTHLPGEVRRTIVATPSGTVFDDVRAGHTSWPETATVGPLPDLAGWLSLVDGEFGFVLVLADREGADIDVYVAPSRPVAEHEEVHGSTLHISKVSPEYAEPQYQQRSENVWMANAKEVAQTVRETCAKHRPRLLVLAGDVRAKADVAEALDGLQVPVEQIDSGSRAAGSSPEAMWAEVHQTLAAYEARDQAALVERLERGAAKGEGVASGLTDVLGALTRHEVDHLVMDLDALHGRTADPAEHPGLPLPPSTEGAGPLRADQVLLAAAVGTGAEATILPSDVSGSEVAATLRWVT